MCPSLGWGCFSLACSPGTSAQPGLSPSSCPRWPASPRLPCGSRGSSNPAHPNPSPPTCPCTVFFLGRRALGAWNQTRGSRPELLPALHPTPNNYVFPPLTKRVLSAYHVSGTVLGSKEKPVNEIDKHFHILSQGHRLTVNKNDAMECVRRRGAFQKKQSWVRGAGPGAWVADF